MHTMHTFNILAQPNPLSKILVLPCKYRTKLPPSYPVAMLVLLKRVTMARIPLWPVTEPLPKSLLLSSMPSCPGESQKKETTPRISSMDIDAALHKPMPMCR